MNQCVSHHGACRCRQVQVDRLRDELDRLRDGIRQHRTEMETAAQITDSQAWGRSTRKIDLDLWQLADEEDGS